MAQDISDWLSSVKLKLVIYADVFRQNDYDSSEDLEGATTSEIDKLVVKLSGISAPAERALRRAIINLQPPEENTNGGRETPSPAEEGECSAVDEDQAAQEQRERRERRETFFRFTWILLDVFPEYIIRTWRNRWNAKYADLLGGQTWERMDPATRGQLCWGGSTDLVQQLSGVVTIEKHVDRHTGEERVNAMPWVSADLTEILEPGDHVLIDRVWCQLLPQNKAVTWSKKDRKGTIIFNNPLPRLPAAGAFDLFAQSIKAETRIPQCRCGGRSKNI